MSRFYFVPDSFVLTEDLKDYARGLGYTELDIKNEEEKWRDHQYKRQMMSPERCWRNWCRNAIKFGSVTPPIQYAQRRPIELTEEQRKADAARAWADLNRLKGVE